VTYLSQPDPHDLVKGVDNDLTHWLLVAADESKPTVTAVEAKVYQGSTLVATLTGSWDGAAGVASATLAAADTSSVTLNDQPWRVVWSLTIGGVAREFERAAEIGTRLVYPGVRTDDLTEDYPDLTTTLAATTANLLEDLDEAWERLRRDLRERDIRLHRIKDPDLLVEPHKLMAASMRYAKAATQAGEVTWKERAGELAERYEEALQRPLPYDEDQDDTADTKPAQPYDDDWFWGEGRRF